MNDIGQSGLLIAINQLGKIFRFIRVVIAPNRGQLIKCCRLDGKVRRNLQPLRRRQANSGHATPRKRAVAIRPPIVTPSARRCARLFSKGKGA